MSWLHKFEHGLSHGVEHLTSEAASAGEKLGDDAYDNGKALGGQVAGGAEIFGKTVALGAEGVVSSAVLKPLNHTGDIIHDVTGVKVLPHLELSNQSAVDQSWAGKIGELAGRPVAFATTGYTGVRSIDKAEENFRQGAIKGLVLNPVNGVEQIVSRATGTHLPEIHLHDEKEVDGSIAGKVGVVAGSAALFAATDGAAAAVTPLEAGSIGSMALSGAVDGGLLTPTSDNVSDKDFLKSRLEGTALGGVSAAVMGGTGSGIDSALTSRLASTAIPESLSSAITGIASNSVGGVAGSLVQTEGNSLVTGHRLATGGDVLHAAASGAEFGAAFGAAGIAKDSATSSHSEHPTLASPSETQLPSAEVLRTAPIELKGLQTGGDMATEMYKGSVRASDGSEHPVVVHLLGDPEVEDLEYSISEHRFNNERAVQGIDQDLFQTVPTLVERKVQRPDGDYRRAWVQSYAGESLQTQLGEHIKGIYGPQAPTDAAGLRKAMNDPAHPELRKQIEEALLTRIIVGDDDNHANNFVVTDAGTPNMRISNIDFDEAFGPLSPQLETGNKGVTADLINILSEQPLLPSSLDRISSFVQKYDSDAGRARLEQLGLTPMRAQDVIDRAKWFQSHQRFPKVTSSLGN